jgi:hypothetical protein
MLQEMDNIEVSCIFYVKVSTFTHLEQSKIALLTVTKSGITTFTVQHNMIVRVSLLSYPWDYLRETSAGVLLLELHPIHIQPLGDFGGRPTQLIPVIKWTTSDRLITNCGVVGNRCNFQPSSVGLIWSITFMQAATYSILT